MGYYINLNFNVSKNAFSKESIIDEFCHYGLEKSHPFDLMYWTEKEGFFFTLSVYDKRDDKEIGHYVGGVRFSWGTDSAKYQKAIEFLFEISKSMNFIIHDGTHNVNFDETNIKYASLIFGKTWNVISGLIGTVKKK
jgi:hypothetical protein